MLRVVRRNSFILTVIGLSLLCVALNEARAEVKGLPFNERFATAAFPFARVLSGCTEWRRPERLGDQWGAVSFAGACRQHDMCYHTTGASWGSCNQQFTEDLKASCDRDLAQDRLGKGKLGTPDGQALKLCYEIAGLYAAKVQDTDASRRFALAQKQQKDYLAWVRQVVSGVYKTLLRRGATVREQDRALESLAQDFTLDDLKAALMGERMDRDGNDPMPTLDDSGAGATDGTALLTGAGVAP